MAGEWDVISSTPVAAPQAADPWAVTTEAKVNPAAASHFDKVISGLKSAGGEAGAIADFFLSAPAFMIGAGAQLTGTVRAMSEGSREPFAQGRAVSQAVNEQLGSPVKKVLDMFRSGDAYEQSHTTKGLEKLTSLIDEAGIWAEKQSGGRISRDAVPMLIETIMAGAPGAAGGKKPFAPEHVTKAMRAQTERMRAEADAAAAEQRRQQLTPQEEQARVPVQQQINDLLGIRTPDEQAKVTRARRKDINNIGRERELTAEEQSQLDTAEARGVRQYGTPEESAFYADERTRNEDTQVRGEETRAVAADRASMERPVGQAEVLEVMRKAPEDRTPQDLMTLRNARQEGKASPEALALTSAAGIGALLGANIDDEKLRGATTGGITGAAFVLPFLGRGASVPSKGRQAGAVKAPGGMWHPEAVERLAEPLSQSMLRGMEREFQPGQQIPKSIEEVPEHVWSRKAIRNYLNKYAGTERDPLKDVEIPWGDGTKTWGELTDQAIGSKPAKAYEGLPGAEAFSKVPETELIHEFGAIRPGQQMVALKKIQDQLSHVGDYLRQNVDPAKLQQYDLVRAVKETAENDKRVAKEMEKAAAESSKDLPVYKEYPDGMKWVELKLPEKLTEEQAKGVRPIAGDKDFPAIAAKHGSVAYEALGPDGKPVKNSYTGEIARGRTPQEAHLAGQLAQEGNQMGHCVGGYCEGVASGESKIYSLRDKKGLSHVTVEVTPPDVRSPTNSPEHFARVKGGELLQRYNEEKAAGHEVTANRKIIQSPEFQEWIRRNPEEISQIKGKQNRAPNQEYLPYVQDFVKEGKWGEVGDLSHTKLQDLQETGRNSTEFRALAEELFPGKRFLDEAESRKLQDEGVTRTIADRDKQLGVEGGRPVRGRLEEGERGSIDQQLLMGLGAVGLGGLIGSQLFDEPGTGALIGALTGGVLRLPGAQRRFKQAVEAADYGIGNISTRIGNISPALKLRARQFEMRNLSEAYERLHKVVPFMQELDKVEGQLGNALDRALLTGDRVGIAKMMQGNRPLVEAWRQVRNVLQEMGTKLQGHGRFKMMEGEYFPRLVADIDGLKEALDIPVRTRLEETLKKAEEKSMKTRGTPLTNIEQSAIINREIQAAYKPRGNQPGYAKHRGVEEVTEELRPFYHTPSESLYAYVRGATTDLEMMKFFGKDVAQRKGEGGGMYIDLDTSVGNVVGRELKDKKITHEQAQQLIDMLKSRFQEGERSPSGLIQEMRNLTNMGLLGNIVSAATQGADALMAVYAQGFKAPLSALANIISGKEHINTKDFGLAEHVAEEFTSPSRTANWLNKMFKYSGFSAIDQFGKNFQLESAFEKYTKLAETPAGVDRIKRKYGEAYGKELPKLLEDLRAGNMTERVRTLMFSELADMQPISKLELPQGYLDHPNGRLMYMLKTFMLKQMDVVRRDVYQEFKKGNVAEGLKNGIGYAAVLGLAGAATDVIKNWLMGRKMSFDGNDVAENILKTFGMGEYVRDKMKQGHPIEALLGAVAPPYKMMDEIIRRDPKAIQYVPIIGKLYYNWELGGREEAELRDAAKAKRQGKDIEISDRALDYRSHKREVAKDKRERAQR